MDGVLSLLFVGKFFKFWMKNKELKVWLFWSSNWFVI